MAGLGMATSSSDSVLLGNAEIHNHNIIIMVSMIP